MIRPIDIRLNAAHPELPLAEAVTFTGAPSTVLIRGVPPNCGRWAITAVSVAATYPDGSTTTRAAVQSANGVWVATIPATARSGRTANGLRVMADGIDENGAAVTGYILGVADFAVASLGVTPAPEPGETSWQMLYFDAVPSTLRKGDVTKVDGVLKLYNGTAWEPFAAPVTFDNAVTKDSANGVKSSGIWAAIWGALAALPTGFSSLYDWVVNQLAGKASTADATLTERGFTEWVCNPSTVLINGSSYPAVIYRREDRDGVYWAIGASVSGTPYAVQPYDETATSLTFSLREGIFEPRTVVATRTALPGYQLGTQTDKPLASESEAEALRQGKQNALSAQQLANIAAVSDALAFDATHTYEAGDPVVYNGTLYTFTSTHTGAWTGSDVSAVDIIARLAGKLDKSGGTMTGNLIVHKEDGPWAEIKAETAQNSIAIRQRGGESTLETDDDTYVIPRGGGTFAMTADIPYDLVTKTIDNGAVSLDDRAINAVAVSSSLASLTVNFPTAPTGKLRDFAMRLNIAAGVTAPEIAWPQGVTLENNGGEVPEIADGGTGGSSTILYFSESENNGTTAKFTVKGETLTAIAQA